MNFKLSLLAIAAVTFAGCSSSYKTGQTPDDVYYSPVRPVGEYQEQDTRDDKEDAYSYEDRQIRMNVYDRRWRTMNNGYYDYYNSPYAFDYGYGYNSGYYGNYHGNYGYNNSPYYYYNPYYSHYPVFYYPGVTIKNPVNRTPRKVNLGAYSSQNSTQKPGTNAGKTIIRNRSYNNSNSTPRKTNKYTPPRTQERPTRTYTPTNNNSSNRSSGTNSSSNSSGGSVNRPARGNN